MKLLKTALITATAAAALSSAAMAQSTTGNPATATATATATILKPLSINPTAAMGFGTVSLTNGNQLGLATTDGAETNVTRVSPAGRQKGGFSLAGSDGNVNIIPGVADPTCGATGITNFNVATPATASLASMSATLEVTGSFNFDSTASGAITCAYTVTAQY